MDFFYLGVGKKFNIYTYQKKNLNNILKLKKNFITIIIFFDKKNFEKFICWKDC